MRHRVLFAFMFAVCLATMAGVAQAQEKLVDGTFGAGFAMPNAEVRDHIGDGYNFNIGLLFNVTPVVSIEGLYSFNGLGQKQITRDVSINPTPPGTPTNFYGDMNMQFFTGSVVLQKPEGAVKPYGLVGMGIYYRPIKVTTPGVGYVPGFCDPWWYYCYPGGFVPVENIVGERSSTDFGMDFGGGIRFNVVYFELRYHYIWGPEVEIPSGAPGTPPTQRKANGQFLQTTFGVRF
jgi:opacity protein-like surface antigen